MTETRCTCGGGHLTFGACIRAKSVSVGYCKSGVGLDTTKEKKWNRELDLYSQARSEGIQPDHTSENSIRAAMEISDKSGVAYGSDHYKSVMGGVA